MTTDRYTKLMLTIIAAALVALVCRDYAPATQAQVQLVPVDVNIVGIDGRRFNSLDVNRQKLALPVKVVE